MESVSETDHVHVSLRLSLRLSRKGEGNREVFLYNCPRALYNPEVRGQQFKPRSRRGDRRF